MPNLSIFAAYYSGGMITVKSFVFNPFAENTFVLSDDSGECMIIDPGCHVKHEEDELKRYIDQEGLKPVKLINTHCHIDHVLGNAFVSKEYNLGLECHEKDLELLQHAGQYAGMYGIQYKESPEPTNFIEEGEHIRFGTSTLDILFVPGHCPGHIALVSHTQKFVIGGDVLFRESIGRTDLPGGNFDVLIESINRKLFKLADDYTVYCGHGPETTIGHERVNNPFLKI